MASIWIDGKRPLNGEVRIQGSKNAALPILAAAVLINGITVLTNCPRILDIHYMLKILESLGCVVSWEGNRITVDSGGRLDYFVPRQYAERMRSSVMFLGPLLARQKKAYVPYPGGCVIGARPVDLHLKALKQMEVSVTEENHIICARTDCLTGNEIHLEFPSVGATENLILAAVTAKGVTRIENAAREPEIVQLCRFLKAAGACIDGVGSSLLVIQGVEQLSPLEFRIESDRIVAGTYLLAAAGTRGRVKLKDAPADQLIGVLSVAGQMGAKIRVQGKDMEIDGTDAFRPAPYIRTETYPGFPTDLQSPVLAVLSKASGESVIEETIFESRFKAALELEKLGADIRIEGNKAFIGGVPALHGARLRAMELRGGAALILGGLMADGETVIEDIHYIQRGYEDICGDLKALGARISAG